MIDMKTIREISESDNEGKILIAALAILTSIKKSDIDDGKWGDVVHPDDALERVIDLANQIYYKEEYDSEKKLRDRDNKLNELGI